MIIDASSQDLTTYPFNATNIKPTFKDQYGRSISDLLNSFVVLTKRVLSNETIIMNVPRNLIETVDRICHDIFCGDDFCTLLDLWKSRNKSSLMSVFLCDHTWILLDDDKFEKTPKPDLKTSTMMIISFTPDSRKWALFLVNLKNHSMDIYLLGDFNSDDILQKVNRIKRFCSSTADDINLWCCKQRLQLHDSFVAKNQFLVFILYMCLSLNGAYLDLDRDGMQCFKISALEDIFLSEHDAWLGLLNPHKLANLTHPFLAGDKYKEEDNFHELEDHGFVAVDVKGDGNCGYYSLILAFENMGIFQYSVDNVPACNDASELIKERQDWQKKVLELRHDLAERSALLLKTTYKEGEEPVNWWWIMQAVGEEERNQLTETFKSDELEQEAYFDDTFIDQTDFHMNPYWASLNVASLLECRVIIYTVASSWSQEKGLDVSWSTKKFEYQAPIGNDNHIAVDEIPNFYRIPDIEYKQKNTVEFLFQTGYREGGVSASNHFQFVRRIVCDKQTRLASSEPQSWVLRDVLQTTALIAAPAPSNQTNQSEDVSTGPPTGNGSSQSTNLDSQPPSGLNSTSTTKQPNKKREIPTRILFDSTRQVLRVSTYDAKRRRYSKFTDADDLDGIDNDRIEEAQRKPDTLIRTACLGAPGDGQAPEHLCTEVHTIYQQHSRYYCLSYSLASALFYCGFKDAASILSSQAKFLSKLQPDEAIKRLKEFMLNLAPEIGRPTILGIRTKSSNRQRRTLDIHLLTNDIHPHPTVVIPFLEDGTMFHAFCVVDDLIFDSITPYALKLQEESIQWIFNDSTVVHYTALRFNIKCSPPGHKVQNRYRRQVCFHWNHPRRTIVP